MTVEVNWATPEDTYKNWYMSQWERRDAVERLKREYGDLTVDPIRAEVLVDSVAYSFNGVFKSLMDAMGQDDGFVGGQFTSDDFEVETSVMLAADILCAGGEGHVPDWDGTPVLDLGKSVGLGELGEHDVRQVIDAYLSALAGQAGVPENAFGTGTRLKLLADMLAYVALEKAFADRDAANGASASPAP